MTDIKSQINKIEFPFTKDKLSKLKAGDSVLISGVIYTARDAAHKRLTEMLDRGESLPFELAGSIIYYVGPTPEKPGNVIGAAGPTTSYRMDSYAPRFLDLGQAGMIGKGQRSMDVHEAVVRNGAIYFAAIGGAGALIAKSILNSEVVAFEDLGAEAVRRLEISEFPAIVVIDSKGNNLYEIGPNAYLEQLK